MTGVTEAKRELRRTMRAMRRALPDQIERSDLLWGAVQELPEVAAATTLLVFESVPGEPITAPFISWCRSQGKVVALPEDEPLVDPNQVDVVIVPGLAFTAAGDRLGQGGGWYDRFLSRIRVDCTMIGVGFQPQLIDAVPTEPHDITMTIVVSDAGALRCGRDDRQ
jgi:5-formyltetrahydrofolate cyclo-ligase